MTSPVVLIMLLSAGAADLTDGPVEKIADGFRFTEGPVWMPDGRLLFSDIPADTIYQDGKTVFRKPSGKSNGLTLDAQGRLIACEHWSRRVTRTEEDGTLTVLADAYEGKKFNSPNDVVVRSDGAIFFTDPTYGLEGRDPELIFSGVYLIPAEGPVRLLTTEFKYPNGLAFSPDEKTLYVGDSGEGLIRAYDVAADGGLSKGRLFCEVPGPDGMKVDQSGRVWVTARDGVRIYDAKGPHVGTIEFPHQPTNCAFGGPDSSTLYVTAREAVYQVRCGGKGIRPLGKK